MCTVSWSITSSGYSIHFNRDEQKTRANAIPPSHFVIDDVSVCMPIDPVGGGSWCCTNEFGLSLSLLNFYQGRMPKGRLTSRGKIVKDCAKYQCFAQVFSHIGALNLNKYAPFSLLCFSLESHVVVNMVRWNGKELIELPQQSPLISSAINYESVHQSRMAVFKRTINDSDEDIDNALYRLHSSHLPSRSSMSICMHRDDAQTVSYSRIVVAESHTDFYYSDGPPCENPVVLHDRFKRQQ